MAFRLVGGSGIDVNAVTVSMYASGVVRPGMVVELETPVSNDSATLSRIAPGGAGTRTTSIFGVCQDYAQGASDTQVRVIAIVPGRLWEADCVNVWTTIQAGKYFQLYAEGSLLNNTSYNHTGGAGVFLVYNVTDTTGSIKVNGTFVKAKITPSSVVGT